MCNSSQQDGLSQPVCFKCHDESFILNPKHRLLDWLLLRHLPERRGLARVLLLAAMASITLSTLLTLFLLLSTLMSLVVKGAPTDPSVLNLTAISAENGQSIFECWQLKAPFLDSNQAGTDGAVFAQLGNASNASFAILPPKFSAGLHNAPFVQ